MNYRDMIAWHRSKKADITLATIQVSPGETSRFGVTRITPEYRVDGFEEKPQHGKPARSIFDPAMVSASMGIYVFSIPGYFSTRLVADARDPNSSHRFPVKTSCRNAWSAVA